MKRSTSEFDGTTDTKKGKFGLGQSLINEDELDSVTKQALLQVFSNEKYGHLSENFRKRSIAKLGITPSYPDVINSLNFASLIPAELHRDARIYTVIMRKLSEAARQHQRVARAKFISEHKAAALAQVFETCITKEDANREIWHIINQTKSEQNWKGSMPASTWFMTRVGKCKEYLKHCEQDKDDVVCVSDDVDDNATPNIFDQDSDIDELFAQPGCSNDSAPSPENTQFNNFAAMKMLGFDYSNSTESSLMPLILSNLSIPCSSNGSPLSLNHLSGLLDDSMKVDRVKIANELENSFSKMSPDKVRDVMVRIQQRMNRRLAEQAADMLVVLREKERLQLLDEIRSISND